MTPKGIYVLTNIGVVIILKRDVIYDLAHFQGFEFIKLYTIQGSMHSGKIREMYYTDTTLGLLLQTTIHCYRWK